MAQTAGGSPRRSSLVFAMCLIAFGIFFLILNLRPDLDLSFFVYRYWPVILIVLGVATLLDRMRSGTQGGRDSGWIVGLIVFFLILAAVSAGPLRHHRGSVSADVLHDSKTIDLQGATSVIASLNVGAGELDLSGGASHLLESKFDYNEVEGAPEVKYYTSGTTGNLSVEQRHEGGIHWGNESNHWELKLADDTPMELTVKMGAGEGDLHMQGLQLTRLQVEMGAGELNLDLSGPWKKDFTGTIHGGVGEATVRLPNDVGVIVHASGGIGSVDASGLHESGDEYTNDAYGKSPITLRITVEGGIGQINLICEK